MATATISGVRRRGLAGHRELHGGRGLEPGLLGLMLFVGSEVMFFAGLFGAYFTFRADAKEWPGLTIGGEVIEKLDIQYAAWLTVILVSSSVTMQLAIFAIRKDLHLASNGLVSITLLLGTLFVAGQAKEWIDLIRHHFTIKDGVYPSLFFTITGFHGLHVLGGVVAISFVITKALGGAFSAKNHVMMESVSFYWHFVDVVWVGVFTSLYILQ